jgi:hypothetical protein
VINPTFFAAAVPLAIWSWKALADARTRAKTLGAAAILAALPIAAALAWYPYARSLYAQYGLFSFKLSHDWLEWTRLIFQTTFLGAIFGRLLHTYLLWPTVIWMVARPRVTARVARDHLDLLAWIVAGLFATILFGSHMYNHPYYALPFLVPIALFIGAFVTRASKQFSRARVIQAAFVVIFAVTALVRVEQRASPLPFDPERLAQAMAHVPREGLTIATDARTPVVSLVILDRIGWALPPKELTPDAIDQLRSQGARILVESSFGGWLPPETRAALPPPFWADDQIRAYRLTPCVHSYPALREARTGIRTRLGLIADSEWCR